MKMTRLPPQQLRKLLACAAVSGVVAGCNIAQDENSQRTGANAGARPPGLTLTPHIPAGASDVYEDVTAQAGITFVHQFCDTRIANIIQSNGAGVAILDYDNDGFMDVYFVNSGPLEGVTNHPRGTEREPNRLYRNRGDGTFEDVTEKAGVAGRGYGVAVAAADYDNDGFTDLLVVNVGSSILYRNRGDGTFEDVTAKAGITHSGTGIGAVFVDVDNDGWLDLFIANYLTFDPNYDLYFNPDAYPGPLSYKPEFNMLFRNRGDGTFEDISERSGIRIPGHRGMSVVAFDFDKDGDQDLYICNDNTTNLLLVNDGKGNFTEQAVKHWVAYNAVGEAAGSMTAAVGDCNGDLIPDILVSRLGYGSLYIGSAQKTFSDELMASGVGAITAQYVGWGSNFIDFDNDGVLDVFIANGDPHHLVGWESLLLKNNGEGKFTDAADIGGAFFRAKLRARGSVIFDFDNDGRMDILVTAIGDRPFLLRNRGLFGNHWIMLDLEGTKSNRDGFGSRITLHAGSKTYYTEARCPAGFLSQSDRRVHVGLGKSSIVDKIEIAWPSGTVQVLENVSADQILKIKEP
jgi:enediyne biosynthesis protein E4